MKRKSEFTGTESNDRDVVDLKELGIESLEAEFQWQAAQGTADFTMDLLTNARNFFVTLTLTALPDQTSTITQLQDEINIALHDQTTAQNTIRDLRDLRAQLAQNADARSTSLQTQLDTTTERDAANTAINDLRTQRLPPSRASKPQFKSERPKEFDGTRSKLQAFIIQLRPHTASYTTTLAELLVGDSLDQIRMYVQNDRVNLADLAAFMTVMVLGFGNPNRVVEAEHKLSTMTQES